MRSLMAGCDCVCDCDCVCVCGCDTETAFTDFLGDTFDLVLMEDVDVTEGVEEEVDGAVIVGAVIVGAVIVGAVLASSATGFGFLADNCDSKLYKVLNSSVAIHPSTLYFIAYTV